MTNYLIHACLEREWYVKEYLVPSMVAQGIKTGNINVYVDRKRDGCLKSFVESGKLCTERGTWHLQDDVIISQHFKERTEQYDNGIVCGFTCRYDKVPKPGLTKSKEEMWWSFPCIRIPDNIMNEFVTWADTDMWTNPEYERYVSAKKYDDYMFKVFLEKYYNNYEVLNLSPNLVDHIDFLLGGSVVNKQRRMPDVRSIYWNEEDLVKKLARELRNKKF